MKHNKNNNAKKSAPSVSPSPSASQAAVMDAPIPSPSEAIEGQASQASAAPLEGQAPAPLEGPIASQAPAVIPPAPEVIRGVEQLMREALIVDGETVKVKEGAYVSASEFTAFITNRETEAGKMRTQARWAFYAACQQPNGEYLQTEILVRLNQVMSRSAIYQLTSEAKTICPLVIANGFKTPLSVLKDAVAELKVDESGTLLPLDKQTEAGRKLIPLLKEGTVSQGKIREIRKACTPGSAGNAGKTPAAPSFTEGKAESLDNEKAQEGGEGKAPEAPSAKADAKADAKATAEAIEYGKALGHVNAIMEYVLKNRLSGDEAKPFVNLACELGRQFGLQVTVPGSK